MIQLLVALLMWALVASMLTLRRKRTNRTMTYASVAIAVAMTLNVDDVYVALDPLLGGSNVTTIVSDALLMVGLFFLGRAVMKAGAYRPKLVRAAVGRTALITALLGISVAFLLIDRGGTTTVFMRDLGSQPAAAVYSIINFTYCGIVVAAMMVLALQQTVHSSGAARIPPVLLCIGAASGVALSLVVIIMDIAHVTGAIDIMHAVDPAYAVLSLTTFAFLCAGFAAQPIVTLARHKIRQVRTDVFLRQITPIWNQAIEQRPGLSSVTACLYFVEEAETRLHRAIVETYDAMLDPRASFTISTEDRALLERAEQHLLGLGPGGSDVKQVSPHESDQS